MTGSSFSLLISYNQSNTLVKVTIWKRTRKLTYLYLHIFFICLLFYRTGHFNFFVVIVVFVYCSNQKPAKSKNGSVQVLWQIASKVFIKSLERELLTGAVCLLSIKISFLLYTNSHKDAIDVHR